MKHGSDAINISKIFHELNMQRKINLPSIIIVQEYVLDKNT